MDENLTPAADVATLIISGDTSTLIDALPQEEREALVAETKPAEPKVEPTELVCNACHQTLPVSAFYRVTKGGKFRQPCRDCYDMRYYGRKHGERKAKAVSVVEATNADEQQVDAIAAVVETLPVEENAPTGQGEPAEIAPVATTDAPTTKSKRKAKVAPVEEQDEPVIHITAE